MTKKIYGGMDVKNNLTTQGNRTVQSIDGTALFDSNGNMLLDGYTQQEINEIAGVLPLSHYGTHNYIPAGVSGDFVGASENPNYRRVKNFIEDDGTFVALRSGSNGSTIGLYYSYLTDILNKTNISAASVNTNKQYSPGFIPSGRKAISCVSTDDKVVCGRVTLENSETVDNSLFYTSIMNGTLDDSQHIGFMINSSTVLPDGGELIFCMRLNDGSILYFGLISDSTHFELSLIQVVFNQIAGTFTSSRITGFNGSVFYSMTNTNNIKIAGTRVSSSTSTQPYLLTDPAVVASEPFMVAYDVFAAQDTSGSIRVRINGDCYIATTTNSIRPRHGFSFVFNPTSKVVALDSGYAPSGAAPMVCTVTSGVPTVTGNVITTDEFYIHQNTGNIGCAYYYTNLNTAICVYTRNLQITPNIQICRYNTNITPYQMQNFKQYTANIESVQNGLLIQSFGSIIGSYITGTELLTNTSTKQLSSQADGNIANSYAIHGSAPTFEFQSVVLGTVNGYQPTVQRAEIPNNNSYKMFMTTVDGSTVTANGGIFVQGVRESTALTYNEQGVGSGNISVDATALLSFKNSEVAKMTFTTISPTASKDCTLYVPRQSDIPAFAIISTVSTSLQYVYRFVEVSVNTRSGNITTITFNRLVKEDVRNSSHYANAQGSITNSSTGITIYNGGTFYFVAGADPMVRQTIGNDLGYYFRGIVDKSTSQFTRLDVDYTYTSYTSSMQPFSFPGQGFGILQQQDLACKMVFRSYGTTIADYDAWTVVGSPINLVSQDVAEGFIVYFTEPTPVMLSGKSFTLPVTSIDLTTVTTSPANKTFYVYVQMVQGIARYTISESVIAETGTTAYNLFWIGTIQTNAIQITNINVLKRSRLDIFGESLTASGSSFPVSYGTPAGTGTINW